jgi:hypothetical protein
MTEILASLPFSLSRGFRNGSRRCRIRESSACVENWGVCRTLSEEGRVRRLIEGFVYRGRSGRIDSNVEGGRRAVGHQHKPSAHFAFRDSPTPLALIQMTQTSSNPTTPRPASPSIKPPVPFRPTNSTPSSLASPSRYSRSSLTISCVKAGVGSPSWTNEVRRSVSS